MRVSTILRSFAVTAALFLAGVLYFFERGPFFYWDEWTLLKALVDTDLRHWLIQTHLGQLFPLGKLFFYLEILAFGDHYAAYLLLNVFLHSVNAMLVFALLRKLQLSQKTAWLGVVFYYFCGAHAENILWAMQSCIFICVFFFLGAALSVVDFRQSASRASAISAGILALLSGLSFGFGLVAPFLLLALAWAVPPESPHSQGVLYRSLGISWIVLTLLFFAGTALNDQSGNHLGAAVNPITASAVTAALSSNDFYGFLSRAVFCLPSEYIFFLHLPGFDVVQISVALWLTGWLLFACVTRLKMPSIRLLLLYAACMLAIAAPIALTRYALGAETMFATRYQAFALLPSLVLLAVCFEEISTKTLVSRWKTPLVVLLATSALWLNRPLVNQIQDQKLVTGTLASGAYSDYRACLDTACAQSPRLLVEGGKRLFQPAINPELTVAEAMRIARFIH